MIKEVDQSLLKDFYIVSEDNPFTKFYAYFKDDVIVGLLEFNHLYEHLDVVNINVVESERRKGIASKLIEELIKYGKKHACVNITLEVSEKNKVAYNLYLKYNFKEVARRKNYYKDSDGILMELIL